MSARRTLPLLAIALAGAVGVAWLWSSVGTRPAESAGETAATSTEEPRPAASSLQRSPETEAPRVEAAPLEAAATTRTESFPLDGAAWIEGHVRMPRGAPADETLLVWAFEPSAAVAMQNIANDLPELVRSGRLEDASWSFRKVEADGSFRVPLPPKSASARLIVDGRYLYLEQPERVVPGLADVVLEPKLGAWIVGRCIPPEGTTAEDSPAGSIVQLDRNDDFFGRGIGGDRSATVALDLSFEMRGVPVDAGSDLRVRPKRFAPARQGELALAEGRKSDVSIPLRPGARVSGRVVDESGAAIADANVSFEERGERYSMYLAGLEPVRSGADGSFELVGLAPGKITVVATKEGFLEEPGAELDLQDGAVRRDVVLTLRRGNSVAGTVRWPDGSPAADVRVQAFQAKEASKDWYDAFQSSSRTAKDGTFTVSGLGASNPVSILAKGSRAEARAPSDNPPTWTAIVQDVKVGSSDTLLVLREPIGVRGRVVDDTGAPLKRFDVEAVAVRDPTPSLAVVNALDSRKQTFESEDGSFLLGGLQPGRWQLRASAPDHVFKMASPTAELPATGAPVDLVLVRAASVAGIVFDPTGAPASGAQVKLARFARDSGGEDESFTERRDPPESVADAKGAFVLQGLPPGPCQIFASASGFAPSAPAAVELDAGARKEGVELHLCRGGRLTGEAFDAKGAHAEGRTVTAATMNEGEPHAARVDAQGRFEIANLAPGTYQVMLNPTMSNLEKLGSGDSGESASNGMEELFTSMKMTSAQITEGETTHVVLGAPPRAPVRLFGTVTRGGEPLKTGMIVCLGEGGGLLSKMKMGTIRPTGEYEIKLDEPGRIVLSLQGGATSEFHATVPEVPEFRFDLEVPAGGLRGVVFGPDSKPAQGVEIGLIRASGASFLSAMGGLGETASDDQGRFSFEGLAPGKYSIAAGGIRADHATFGAPAFGRSVVTGLQVGRDKVLEGVEIRLGKPGSIAGTVRDSDGQPVAGATVFARDANGELLHAFSGVVTGSDGRFTYAGIADGSYTLSARSKTLVSPESAAVLVRDGKSVDVELAVAPGTTLVVSIEDKDGTALRASFSVKDDRGREMAQMMDASGIEGVMLGGISSTENKVGPLAAGEYKVSATSFDGRSASKTVKLRGQDERSVKLRLE